MTSFGKKFLSAFVEVSEAAVPALPAKPVSQQQPAASYSRTPEPDSKFREYFDKLFTEADRPGPDYYEFSRMIGAMMAIPDEKARFSAAFAGLQIQGLDKQKLLATAAGYLQLLDRDAAGFDQTIHAAMQEQVLSKEKEIEEKKGKIRDLSAGITGLHNSIKELEAEIKDNKEKIDANAKGYGAAEQQVRNTILQHIEKINQHIQ